MVSGNESLVPRRYWDHLGVIDGMYGRLFPSFYKFKFDLGKGTMSLRDWPRGKNDDGFIFIQGAGVRYHFSGRVWGLQQSILERAIRQGGGSRLSKGEVLNCGVKVLERMFREWRVVLSRHLEVKIEIEKGKLSGIDICDRGERLRELKLAGQRIDEEGSQIYESG